MKRTLAGSKKIAILGDSVNSLHHCIGHQRGSNAAWNVLSGKTTWHDASGYQLYQTLSILKKWHLLLEESHLFPSKFLWAFYSCIKLKFVCGCLVQRIWSALECRRSAYPKTHSPLVVMWWSRQILKYEITKKSWLKSCKIAIPIQFMRNLVGFQTIASLQLDPTPRLMKAHGK